MAASKSVEIPEKAYYRIGEVSRLTATKAFVLRYWETEFPMLQPIKSSKGQRLYRRQDIETVLAIKRLLYDEGFTIAGARRYLKEGNGGGQELVVGSATSGERAAARPVHDERPAKEIGKRMRQKLTAVRDELLAILTLLERK
jgi:DNA-binding transcriptional MerR regulator